MLTSIKSCLKQLLIQPSCAICKRQTISETDQTDLCQTCQQRLGLAETAIKGMSPLPWRAASWYRGAMRQLILSLRRNQNVGSLQAICRMLQRDLQEETLLIPIPGWKAKSRSNPLPELMCRCLERPTLQVLERCRPTVGQHRLNRRQRESNQCGSFTLNQAWTQSKNHEWTSWPTQQEVWIVDDIVTTGATVLAAQQALQASGTTIQGVLCLARTPWEFHPVI
ncbi:ComF family protein [Synechococcus sp. UW179A]|uniref:ComF family protein n=1 Tax=Synechococcus sp. UW179A TaxID=2575510 RepID=UPI000E0EFD16|nr:ComF family protein [Synechococcus sp. UW179A]